MRKGNPWNLFQPQGSISKLFSMGVSLFHTFGVSVLPSLKLTVRLAHENPPWFPGFHTIKKVAFSSRRFMLVLLFFLTGLQWSLILTWIIATTTEKKIEHHPSLTTPNRYKSSYFEPKFRNFLAFLLSNVMNMSNNTTYRHSWLRCLAPYKVWFLRLSGGGFVKAPPYWGLFPGRFYVGR